MECKLSFTEVHVSDRGALGSNLYQQFELNMRNLICRSEIFKLFNLLTTPYNSFKNTYC